MKVLSDFAIEMIHGIEQIHKTGRVHRDIKPENVRVHNGKIYITDFGSILAYNDSEGNFNLPERATGF